MIDYPCILKSSRLIIFGFLITLNNLESSYAYASSILYIPESIHSSAEISDQIYLAENSRKKNIITESRVKASKRGDKTEIDLEEAVLDGSARTPALSTINSSKANTDYNFVKIRLRWHPEMIQSAASLDTKM